MRRSKQAGTRKGRTASFRCVYKLRRRDGTEYDGWFARFDESGRRVQRGGFLTGDAAEDFLARHRVEQSERRALCLPELQRVSVEDGIKRYLAWSKEHRRLGTHKSNSTYLTALSLKWGGRDLISLTGNDVVRALEERRRWVQDLSSREEAWAPRPASVSAVSKTRTATLTMRGDRPHDPFVPFPAPFPRRVRCRADVPFVPFLAPLRART